MPDGEKYRQEMSTLRHPLLKVLTSIEDPNADGLEMLRDLQTAQDALDRVRDMTVLHVRRRGASWRAIGDALGVPRQLAWRRWSDADQDGPE